MSLLNDRSPASVITDVGNGFENMTSENRRVLIVEAEYLVAMEAERILIELFACAVEIVTLKAFPSLLRQNGRYDLVILDLGRAEMPPDEPAWSAVLDRLMRATYFKP